MAKSQDTYTKKEKEKARLKKQDDKKRKKEERKSHSNRGQDFTDMLAYVDENGNLSSVPPDPTKRSEIKAENIAIGVPAHEDIIPQGDRSGIVSFFNHSKGYGFIKDLQTQESVFVHSSQLIDAINDNDKVLFEIEMTPKGASAIKVRRA